MNLTLKSGRKILPPELLNKVSVLLRYLMHCKIKLYLRY